MPRTPAFPVDPLLLNRWSPRSMNATPLSAVHRASLFEGARWSPSAGNGQPWRFVYANHGTAQFAALLSALDDGNRTWCAQAGALVVTCVNVNTSRGTPNRTAFFEAGMAWLGLALQASAMGLVAHAMAGFKLDEVRKLVGASAAVEVIIVGAVGYPGDVEELSEKDRAREFPSDRKPQEDWVFEGKLPS